MKQQLLSIRNEFNALINELEQELKERHEEEIYQANRRGEQDGLENTPGSESTKLNAVEREIFHSYSKFLHEFRFDVQGWLTRIRTDYVAILDDKRRKESQKVTKELKELEERTYRQLRRMEEENHEKIQLLNEDGDLHNLKEKFLEVDDVYAGFCKQTGRKDSDIIWDVNIGLYSMIFVILGIAEVAAMYNAFLGFEEPPLTTWAWAIGFGLVMSLLSHFNGLVFSQARAKINRIWLGILLVLLAIGTIVAVSYVRTGALDEEVPVKHLSLPAFILISFIVYIVGVLLSFLCHDSNTSFYRTLKKREKLLNQIHQRKKQLYDERVKLQNELHENEKKVNAEFEKERSEILSQTEEAEGLLRDAVALHDEILQGARNFEKMIVQMYKECIESYRQKNAATRGTAEPVYWSEDIPDLETVFDKIDKLDPGSKNTGLWHYN